jgi:hypothetical protein
MNYVTAAEKLGSRDSRKVGNNTYLERLDDETIGLRLHSTYVVKFHADGSVTLDSGGWQTVTTKERMGWADGISVFQRDFAWFVRLQGTSPEGYRTFAGGETIAYSDGMRVKPL